MEHYLSVVRECLEMGISPRCHLEDITRADIYGYVIPFCLELMKLMQGISDPDQSPLPAIPWVMVSIMPVL